MVLHKVKLTFVCIIALLLLLTACAPPGGSSDAGTTPTPRVVKTPTAAASPTSTTADICPGQLRSIPNCFTPHALRVAYGMETLTEQGFTGKGQTVVDIVSFGSPTLQQDMNVFDQQFGLPSINVQVLSPIGTKPFDPNNQDMVGWAVETELDVQIIHAMAPDAGIVVLTSPVDETEGTIGLPQFLQLEQYAVSHHLGQIFSQSFVATEVTLTDSAGQKLVKQFADFYQQATTQQGWTIVSGSGDHGATDYSNIAATQFSPTPTVDFPADVPWVTAVGGTRLQRNGNGFTETAWPDSGGGISKFFGEPDYQKSLPAAVQGQLNGHRGLPDVAADADPATGMAFYIGGQWQQVGGTSASTPLWAGIIAVADQMAGHPLGFINPGIYKVATSPSVQQDFRDITIGNNSFSQGQARVTGFDAVPGWDPVTGWGAPNAQKLLPDLIAALK
ncbi:MAG TPA: S53 family peptidase [Ktedonobacteraceae bacterium]|jgi:subtilase family serine protease|nr:S53 family peptidase [Ktedonobacteraceae bacterium]